jgi:rhodanese-related sulfurtransferase
VYLATPQGGVSLAFLTSMYVAAAATTTPPTITQNGQSLRKASRSSGSAGFTGRAALAEAAAAWSSMAFGFSVSGSWADPSSTARTRVAVDGSMRRFTSGVLESVPRAGAAEAGAAGVQRAKRATEPAVKTDTNHRLRGLDWVMGCGVLQDFARSESRIARFGSNIAICGIAVPASLCHSGLAMWRPRSETIEEITVEQLAAWLAEGKAVALLDVREPWEHELAALPGSALIPLGELSDSELDLGDDPGTPSSGRALLAYCHHGVRSLSAVAILRDKGWAGPLYSLAGGIDAWSCRIDPSVPRY